MGKLFTPRAVLLAVGLWAAAVGLGAFVLVTYANTPGKLAEPASEWPANPFLTPSQGKQTLMIFAHPECPCSRATIEELAQIMAFKSNVEAFVLFFAPTGIDDWKNSDLYASARRIPGVHVLSDINGAAGKRFGARTSGQTLVYDADGRLVFNGGITATRGHVGDNDGVDSIIALARGRTPKARTTPVFGCSLYGDN